MLRQIEYDYKIDLEIISSMVERLETYLRSDEVYGNQGMFIEGLPAITLGGLLIRIRRLNALRELMGKSGQQELDSAIAEHDAIYNEWRVHYEEKLRAELDSRIKRIQQFIDETKDNPQLSTLSFEPEQMRRTIIQEILYMMQRSDMEADATRNKLNDLDTELKQLVKEAEFRWSPVLKTLYSPDEFWWLYSHLDVTAIANGNE